MIFIIFTNSPSPNTSSRRRWWQSDVWESSRSRIRANCWCWWRALHRNVHPISTHLRLFRHLVTWHTVPMNRLSVNDRDFNSSAFCQPPTTSVTSLKKIEHLMSCLEAYDCGDGFIILIATSSIDSIAAFGSLRYWVFTISRSSSDHVTSSNRHAWSFPIVAYMQWYYFRFHVGKISIK